MTDGPGRPVRPLPGAVAAVSARWSLRRPSRSQGSDRIRSQRPGYARNGKIPKNVGVAQFPEQQTVIRCSRFQPRQRF